MLAGSKMNEAAAFNPREKKGTGVLRDESCVRYGIGVGGVDYGTRGRK
jgi:hypothetical protein